MGPSEKTPAPVIVGSSGRFPRHVYTQAQMTALMQELLADSPEDAAEIARMFVAVGVERRHFALAADAYRSLGGFAQRSAAWLEVGLELAEAATRAALAEAELDASELDLLLTTSVTGIAVPTLDARLINRLGLGRASGLARLPCFGLGCVGGAAGLARVSDYLRGYPDRAALLLAVELCSLSFQRDDASVANRIACGLFGDGAAAVVVVGGEHPAAAAATAASGRGPTVLDSRAAWFPGTEALMGWDIVDTGFSIVLDPGVPALVERELPALVDGLLAAHGLRRVDIAAWVAHPGGPKVIAAIAAGLGLAPAQLDPTREGLARIGNLSSASVLVLLDEFRHARAPAPGSYGLLFALGPGFCAELVLLRW